MHLVYMDDSKDQTTGIFTAIILHSTSWHDIFAQLKTFRSALKKTDGIYVNKEFHATEFIGGRGRIAPSIIPKFRRSEIFKDLLSLAATLPLNIINSIHPNARLDWSYERILTRIHNTMKARDDHAIIISDKGNEGQYTGIRRRLGVINYIPSQYGRWGNGSAAKNIPLDRIIEDQYFKDSKQSYFIQLADFCAYALLRREKPLVSKTKYGMDKAFETLKPVLFLEANRSDPDGIIRI